MRYLIDAMIGGAEKAGTTSLGHYVTQHPRILSHFHVGDQRIYHSIEFPAFVSGSCKDPSQFERDFLKAFKGPPATDELVMAKSVGVLHRYQAAINLKDHNPECRLILMLRNPIDRAYSSFWYQLYRGEEIIQDFEKAVEIECSAKDPLKLPIDRRYLGKGLYFEQLNRLYTLFDPNQVFVLLLDDLKSKPNKAINEIFRFLGLEPVPVKTEVVVNRAKRVRSSLVARAIYKESFGKRITRILVPRVARIRLLGLMRQLNSVEESPPPMSTKMRSFLIDYFRPHNRKLQELLQRDLSQWNK